MSLPRPPVAGQVIGTSVTYTNRSGTIVSANTSQVLAAANSTRRGFFIQNLSDTQHLWVNLIGGAATAGAPSVKLLPNAIYETPSHGCTTAQIQVLGPTAGQTFTATEW